MAMATVGKAMKNLCWVTIGMTYLCMATVPKLHNTNAKESPHCYIVRNNQPKQTLMSPSQILNKSNYMHVFKDIYRFIPIFIQEQKEVC